MLISIMFLPMVSLESEAPLEVIPYKVVRHPWELDFVNKAFFLSIIFLSFVVIFVFLYNIKGQKDKREKVKGLLYGSGILLLFLPAILCVFVDPIFARIGYTVGAILIYNAFRIKTKGG
jgi:hypothetical protein